MPRDRARVSGCGNDAPAGERPQDAEAATLQHRAKQDRGDRSRWYGIGEAGNAAGDHQGASGHDVGFGAPRCAGDQNGEDRPGDRFAGDDESDGQRRETVKGGKEKRPIEAERAGGNRERGNHDHAGAERGAGIEGGCREQPRERTARIQNEEQDHAGKAQTQQQGRNARPALRRRPRQWP